MSPAAIQPDDTLAASFSHGASIVSEESRSRPLRTFLFGYPISHSMAPLLHATLFKGVSLPWTYTLHETQDASEFLPHLKHPDVVGCAVTMPYKVKMMSVVDHVTDEARVVGAINTVFLRRTPSGATRYIGTNTDCVGVREAFLQNFPGLLDEARGRPAMVIGGGGACRASVYALHRWLGASRIYLVNRLESEVRDMMEAFTTSCLGAELIHVASVEQAAALETPVLVVGTVPDLPPKEPGEVTARRIVSHFLGRPEKGYILEMCYHPRPRTEFYGLGEEAGWHMIYGTEPMIWQGVAQQVLWAEMPIDRFNLDEAKRVIDDAIEQH